MLNANRRTRLAAVVIALCVSTTANADVKLANLFAQSMVMQQGGPVPVWGTGEAGEAVAVTLAGQSAMATTDANGKWVAQLPPLPVGGPYEMVVKGKNEVKIGDVMVGEVWIASGQSNMEFTVRSTKPGDEEKAAADLPGLRMFTVAKAVTSKPAKDVNGAWVVCKPETFSGFSAVGYYFARELHKSLGVPVGIIHTSWGGTPAESWTPLAALEADPELKPIADRSKASIEAFSKQLDDWRAAMDKAEAEGTPFPPAPAEPRGHPWRASGLYNAMLAPIVPYSVKGAIWYQGESNAPRAFQYRKLLPTMIKSWREAWKQPEEKFPFHIVQLANFTPQPAEPGESDWAELREAQTLTSKMPGNGLAVAIDIGDANDIHPKNKQDVGKRLALVALAKNYGKTDVVYSGPEFESMTVESGKARIKFKGATGLMTKDSSAPKGFAIAGADHKWYWGDATIDGESVVVRSDKVAQPVAVRYAWAHNPPTNLYNKAGLPAMPFRTDDWKGVTADAK